MLAPRPARDVHARLLGWLLPVLALVVVGCDKAPLTAPTDSSVVLFASSRVVALNGTVEITANVLEPGGIPVQNGTQVTFVTTLGTLEPSEARTQGGRATVRLHAGNTSGIARVTAFTGGASAEALEVRVGASAATRIALSASPSSLPPRGGTTEILAVVTDDENRRLEGVPVTFSANAGALRDTTVVTDRFGEARTILTATRETTVTATVGSVSATTTVRVTTAPLITLSGPATAIGEGENAIFTVGVQVGANGDPIREVTINFGDGDVQSLGALTGTRTVSHIYRRAGTYRVEVTATDLAFDPPELTAEVGEDLAIVLTSEDMLHDFTIDELDVHVAADRGDTAEGALRADEPGTYTYYCSVPGHRDAGMEGTLTVTDG